MTRHLKKRGKVFSHENAEEGWGWSSRLGCFQRTFMQKRHEFMPLDLVVFSELSWMRRTRLCIFYSANALKWLSRFLAIFHWWDARVHASSSVSMHSNDLVVFIDLSLMRRTRSCIFDSAYTLKWLSRFHRTFIDETDEVVHLRQCVRTPMLVKFSHDDHALLWWSCTPVMIMNFLDDQVLSWW